MWLGELITERGIGNGISFIIFAGIVSRRRRRDRRVPVEPEHRRASSPSSIIAIAAVAVIIYIQEGQRRIPIQYASRVRGRRMYQGGQTFLPLRVNQAGVIPIIFAVSILLFPSQIASYFTTSRGRHRRGHRATASSSFFEPALAALRRPVLPADGRVHLLLHGVHVQAGRDGRAAPQERRLHPGHPAGPPDAGLPGPGGVSGSRSPAPSSWASSRSLRRSLGLIFPSLVVDRARRHRPAHRRSASSSRR